VTAAGAEEHVPVSHTRPSPRRRPLAAAGLCLVAMLGLAACTGSAVEPPEPTGRATTGACDDATFGAIEAAVAGQLDAFAAGDWAQALTYATAGFRADVDPDELEQIITQGFPVVADYETYLAAHCTVAGDQARLAVEVTDSAGADLALVYLLEREDGGWHIAGAVPADAEDDGPGIAALSSSSR
jgi:hypothetical protein